MSDKSKENPPVIISGEQILKGYHHSGRRIDVLKDLDISVSAGQSIGIIGPSGIGKSTLLHILGTLDRPESGKLIINGEDVFELDDERLAVFRNRSVGFVFQFHHLLPEFTAIENTMMPALIKGEPKKASYEKAEEILEKVGLKERIAHRASELSGGEQQRVALARALILNPLILLADEPTGNLDQKNSEQIHELLLTLNQSLKMITVVVTHNQTLASLMSRCVTIEEGKLKNVELT